jgi:hypothetical protein
MKPKFIWSNEDAALILGGLVSLLNINFNPHDPAFALTVGAMLKGLMSMFSVTLGNDASEDVVLMVGSFVTLGSIGYDYKNPIFFLTLGAIVKAGFGIFGISVPGTQGPTTSSAIKPNPNQVRADGMILLLIGAAFLFAPKAHAGYLIASQKAERTSLTLNLPAGTDLYLMPIEGFQVGANLPKPTYGFSLNEDVVLGQISTTSVGTNLSPILGLGASIYADVSGPVNNNGPLLLMVGGNAIGPDLDLFGLGNGQGLVPGIFATHDFVSKETKVTGGLTVFTDLGPGTAVKIAGQ